MARYKIVDKGNGKVLRSNVLGNSGTNDQDPVFRGQQHNERIGIPRLPSFNAAAAHTEEVQERHADNGGSTSSGPRDDVLENVENFLDSNEEKLATFEDAKDAILKSVKTLHDIQSPAPGNKQKVVMLKRLISSALRKNTELLLGINKFMPEFARFEVEVLDTDEAEAEKRSGSKMVTPAKSKK